MKFLKILIILEFSIFLVKSKYNSNYDITDFSTKEIINSIIEEEETKELNENVLYNQTAFQNEEYKYKINIPYNSSIKRVFIDVLTYAGEVEVNISYPHNLEVNDYISINKIYLSVKIKDNTFNNSDTGYIIFYVKALTKTFYTILCNLGTDENEVTLTRNELPTGLSYLITVDPSKKEENNIVTFNVNKKNEANNLMFSFYSLNCKINVSKTFVDSEGKLITKDLFFFEFLSYDIFDSNKQKENFTQTIDYRIDVLEKDYSKFPNLLCQLYAYGIELTNDHNELTKDILIPDNIPQQVVFNNNVKHVSFGYIHVEPKNNIIITFNLKHKAQYKIKLYYSNIKRDIEEIILDNSILHLSSDEWRNYINGNESCYIKLDITLEKSNGNAISLIEFIIKSVESNIVSYIPRNILRLDYAKNMNSQYYYTELGGDEEGFIALNFYRGSGMIYARIVQKDNKEINGTWRGSFILPNEKNSIPMNNYIKKVEFNTNNYNCSLGCYLLINICSNVIINYEEIINYPFSVIVHTNIMTKDYDQIPKINIQVNEFIIGSIKEKYPQQIIFEFYSVTLNSDAKFVMIDFQSNSGGLFINIGTKRPLVHNSHYSFFPKGDNTIFVLSKYEILNKTQFLNNSTSIENVILTFGVWTNISDSIYTTPFAFIVRLQNGDANDLYRVNSDQKSFCFSKEIKDKNIFRCVYMIDNNQFSHINSLLVYPTFHNKFGNYNMYGKIIHKSFLKDDNLFELFPTSNDYDISNSYYQPDFLLIERGLEINKYLFVSIESDTETTIELISSFYFFQLSLTINPSTPQLIMVFKIHKYNLSFSSNDNETINIKGINGKAELFWSSNPSKRYYLRGRNDRLSIISERKEKSDLIVVSESDQFIFFIEYNIRSLNYNFDQLILDESNNYCYSENYFPLMYYALLNSFIFEKKEYYELFFSFDALENENNTSKYYRNTLFEINGFIVREYIVYLIKKNLLPQFAIDSDKILGKYDPALKTGLIRISNDNIETSGIKDHENPYIFLIINEKDVDNDKNKVKLNYKRISLEMAAIKSKQDVFASELSYQFGKIDKNENNRKYKLRIDNSFKYMNLKFSCLNNTALSIKIENYNELKEGKEEYGRKIYSFKTTPEIKSFTLVISRNNDDMNSEQYFTFQYTHSNNPYNNDYSIKDTKIYIDEKVETKTDNNIIVNYKISITPVENYRKYNIKYIIRPLNDKSMKGSKSDLSLRFDKAEYILEYNNPEIDPDKNKLVFNYNNIPDSIEYIQIIAQIVDEEVIEYLSYDIKPLKEIGKEDKNKEKKYLIIAISIGSVFAIITITLIVITIIVKCKNKGLIDKVTKISFTLEEDSVLGVRKKKNSKDDEFKKILFPNKKIKQNEDEEFILN